MITLDVILKELQRYGHDFVLLYPGTNDTAIKGLELKMGRSLPGNFKKFLKKCNGFEILSDRIYGIHSNDSIDLYQKAFDLYGNYLWEKDESNNPIWPHLLPIAPDGRGNHYCLDLNTLSEDKTECKVIFWQHDYDFSKDDPPDIDTETFLEFLWKLLIEIREFVNYDGTFK